MRGKSAFASAGIGTALVLGFVAAPAHAGSVKPTASAACYVYVSPSVGYLNVRAAKNSTSRLIVKYTGTRLTPQGCEYEETGSSYRCNAGEPQYNNWAPVIYNGVKRYVAMECSGGWGA
jgi:hypothetical protein